MGRERTVQTISRIITCINAFELLLSGFFAAVCFLMTRSSGGEAGSTDAAEVSPIGNLFGAVIVLLAALWVVAFLYFIAPVVKGIILWAKSERILKEDPQRYFLVYRNDGIFKVVFNGIPVVVLGLPLLLASGGNFAVIISELIILLFPVVLSVYQIRISAEGIRQG